MPDLQFFILCVLIKRHRTEWSGDAILRTGWNFFKLDVNAHETADPSTVVEMLNISTRVICCAYNRKDTSRTMMTNLLIMWMKETKKTL